MLDRETGLSAKGKASPSEFSSAQSALIPKDEGAEAPPTISISAP
jgi:hypothetical protein